MRIGIIGTGAIAAKHAESWLAIGCEIAACANRSAEKGRAFAQRWGARFVADASELCRAPEVDIVDVCTFPDYRREPIALCASLRKPVQVQKPLSRTAEEAREIAEIVRGAGLTVSVVSQHRFDDSSRFLFEAFRRGRLGRILQADCYVKWYRPPSYYARPGKGAWDVEGGGALINQAIHGVDLLRWLVGPVRVVGAAWQLGALHRIPSEDVVNALLRFENEATGVLQAATAFYPGYSERLEFHGTKGSAIVTGDQLTHWDVLDDEPDAPSPPLVSGSSASGASAPMAISNLPLERQFRDFVEAIHAGRDPLVTVEDGVAALEIVEEIYKAAKGIN